MINTVKQGSWDREIWLFLRLVDNLKNNLKNRKNLIGNKLQHVIHMPSNDICPEPGVTCNFALCCLYRVVSTVLWTALTSRIVFQDIVSLLYCCARSSSPSRNKGQKKKFALTHILRILYNTPQGYNKNFAEEPWKQSAVTIHADLITTTRRRKSWLTALNG